MGGSYYKKGRSKDSKKGFIGNFIIKTSGKNKKKKGGRRPEGHITDPRNTRKEEMSRRQRRMEVSSEGCRCPEGAVAPLMGGWVLGTGVKV
jgi:hypothetical protein